MSGAIRPATRSRDEAHHASPTTGAGPSPSHSNGALVRVDLPPRSVIGPGGPLHRFRSAEEIDPAICAESLSWITEEPCHDVQSEPTRSVRGASRSPGKNLSSDTPARPAVGNLRRSPGGSDTKEQVADDTQRRVRGVAPRSVPAFAVSPSKACRSCRRLESN